MANELLRRPFALRRWTGSPTLLLCCFLACCWLGCTGEEGPNSLRADSPPSHHPWLVIGIDGAEWGVIEALWARQDGNLPHLRALVERGVRCHLATDYAASPVIWTTIATGRRPEVHGITNFVVPTPQGDVPVSSGVRKVPALWNMLSHVGRKVAVLGWWASWPAEAVEGIVVSDRALLPVPNRVSPPELEPRFDAWVVEALALPNEFGGNPAARDRDQVVAEVSKHLVGGDFDLILAYFRGVDIESHASWKYWQPEGFGVPADALEANRDRIPAVYRATDRAIGEVLEAAGGLDDLRFNVMVLSDHGFHALPREEVQILLDMNRVLEQLGWWVRGADGEVDLSRTRAYSYGTAKNRKPKRLRWSLAGREEGGTVDPGKIEAERSRLGADLARLTWEDGSPAFVLVDADARERRSGADLMALVQERSASPTIFLDGQPLEGLVEELSKISGSHSPHTNGIFVAAGPDLDSAAGSCEGISIFDIAPTLLYGLGLPTAEDFAGRAMTELWSEAFRSHHAQRRIASWGTREGDGSAETSAADQELLEELQALGYI